MKSPSADIPPWQLRALLLWPGGEPPAELRARLDEAGVSIDVAASPEVAIVLAKTHAHDVVLCAPPEAGDLWLSPLRAAAPWLETIALVDPRDPRADLARRLGVNELVDPFALAPIDLADLVQRATQRSRLRGDNRRLLDENVEALRTQVLYRRCLDLLATIEIEVLQELIVKVFSELTEAKSAALWLRTRRGTLTLRAHQGLIARAALPAQIDPEHGPLAARIESGEPFAAEPTRAAPGFYVPLSGGGTVLGLLLLADKLGGPFAPQDLAKARTVADFAGLALRNARRFHDLEKVGLRDRESPTYNLSYFIDYAGKELYKASRYGRQFSLSTLRIENLELLRARLAPSAVAATLRRLIGTLAGLARDSDVLARVAEGELYLILPETDRFGVLMLERRIQDAVQTLEEQAADERPPLAVTIGSATFPLDGRDFDELLARCRERANEAVHTLQRRLHLSELDFWGSLRTLLAPWPTSVEAQQQASDQSRAAAASYRGPLVEDHFARVQRELGRELAREPHARGLLYIGTGEAAPEFPFLELLPPEIGARVCVLIRRGLKRLDHPAVSTVFLQGASPLTAAALQLEFLLFLSETGAYAYARRQREPIAFHSSDRPLVDHLISRLQHAFDLQPY